MQQFKHLLHLYLKTYMKQLILFYLHYSFLANAVVKDRAPANIKSYAKEQFLKEFGKDETSKK